MVAHSDGFFCTQALIRQFVLRTKICQHPEPRHIIKTLWHPRELAEYSFTRHLCPDDLGSEILGRLLLILLIFSPHPDKPTGRSCRSARQVPATLLTRRF